MHAHTHCPHCNAPAAKVPSRSLRTLVVVGAWTATLAFVFGGISLGPGIVVALPIIVLGGVATITGAHIWAYGDRACYACGKMVEVGGVPVDPSAEPERLIAA
ncbi:hypothetical protein ENSA5_40710 [Enhygromyxa salina]|uniref:Uncharacterized protein n=1 Tax=Enhygromyxa salina TaxID=215803 RepID=A0A2S9XP07_9BACT|nr:hypothetical protein [Enhygromyxa salina]PRP94604.1 hypothetical protein ENSA5_40710 [Enhygromyxa salina]